MMKKEAKMSKYIFGLFPNAGYHKNTSLAPCKTGENTLSKTESWLNNVKQFYKVHDCVLGLPAFGNNP